MSERAAFWPYCVLWHKGFQTFSTKSDHKTQGNMFIVCIFSVVSSVLPISVDDFHFALSALSLCLLCLATLFLIHEFVHHEQNRHLLLQISVLYNSSAQLIARMRSMLRLKPSRLRSMHVAHPWQRDSVSLNGTARTFFWLLVFIQYFLALKAIPSTAS